jgi:hypothetical protein
VSRRRVQDIIMKIQEERVICKKKMRGAEFITEFKSSKLSRKDKMQQVTCKAGGVSDKSACA